MWAWGVVARTLLPRIASLSLVVCPPLPSPRSPLLSLPALPLLLLLPPPSPPPPFKDRGRVAPCVTHQGEQRVTPPLPPPAPTRLSQASSLDRFTSETSRERRRERDGALAREQEQEQARSRGARAEEMANHPWRRRRRAWNMSRLERTADVLTLSFCCCHAPPPGPSRSTDARYFLSFPPSIAPGLRSRLNCSSAPPHETYTGSGLLCSL